MRITVEQFWQDLGEVEKRVQEQTKEVLRIIRDESNQQNILNGVTMNHEGVLVEIKGITEDYCLDVLEVGMPELLGMHIYDVASFDIYELLMFLRYVKDNFETNLNARMEDEGDETGVE
jgi:hypothetical protein